LPARAFDQPATGVGPPVNAVSAQSPQQSALLRMPLVTQLLPSLVELQTQVVLASCGEPLLNPEWAEANV
jgi:hypothetical protein